MENTEQTEMDAARRYLRECARMCRISYEMALNMMALTSDTDPVVLRGVKLLRNRR